MPLKNLLHASFLVFLKCHEHGHVHIGNARIQRGTWSLEPPGKQGVLKVSIEKMQFGPITLEKVGPPEICDPSPLSGLFKNYSFF